jgi:hypothetical protein
VEFRLTRRAEREYEMLTATVRGDGERISALEARVFALEEKLADPVMRGGTATEEV